MTVFVVGMILCVAWHGWRAIRGENARRLPSTKNPPAPSPASASTSALVPIHRIVERRDGDSKISLSLEGHGSRKPSIREIVASGQRIEHLPDFPEPVSMFDPSGIAKERGWKIKLESTDRNGKRSIRIDLPNGN